MPEEPTRPTQRRAQAKIWATNRQLVAFKGSQKLATLFCFAGSPPQATEGAIQESQHHIDIVVSYVQIVVYQPRPARLHLITI